MKLMDRIDAAYTAAGITSVIGIIIMFTIFSWFGWVGWLINLLMICGLGAILGDFIQKWHIDYKFRDELNSFEQNIKDALNLKNESNDLTT